MRAFLYQPARSIEQAVAMASRGGSRGTPPPSAPGQFLAGGTNIADYMKLDVMRPERLVDINALAGTRLGQISMNGNGLRLGALVRMGDAQEHPQIKSQYPLIAETLRLAASQQIRNMASLGGNVLQRTRCEYFRDTSWACNKREPGSGCSALGGENRQHAILGTSENCIATYPGDFAQALIALDATVETAGPTGGRTIRFAQLHRRPGNTPNVETMLEPGELITYLNVPAGPWTARSHYVKVRDRESYQFALASAAVALAMDGETVGEARIALGGVATVPWRSRPAEDSLRGKTLDEDSAIAAAEAAFAEARTAGENALKLPLGRATLVRALLETRDMQV